MKEYVNWLKGKKTIESIMKNKEKVITTGNNNNKELMNLRNGYLTGLRTLLIDRENIICLNSRATENRFFAGSDRFLVCKTDSVCIKRIFFGPKKKTHFADHILAKFPGLVKCQTVIKLSIIIPIINVVNTLELLNREKWGLTIDPN